MRNPDYMNDYQGFHILDLGPAFDKVKDSEDWRNPIRAVVSAEDLGITIAAIEFFTGTDVIVENATCGEGSFVVISEG